jgi:hypothetical protein
MSNIFHVSVTVATTTILFDIKFSQKSGAAHQEIFNVIGSPAAP